MSQTARGMLATYLGALAVAVLQPGQFSPVCAGHLPPPPGGDDADTEDEEDGEEGEGGEEGDDVGRQEPPGVLAVESHGAPGPVRLTAGHRPG